MIPFIFQALERLKAWWGGRPGAKEASLPPTHALLAARERQEAEYRHAAQSPAHYHAPRGPPSHAPGPRSEAGAPPFPRLPEFL